MYKPMPRRVAAVRPRRRPNLTEVFGAAVLEYLQQKRTREIGTIAEQFPQGCRGLVLDGIEWLAATGQVHLKAGPSVVVVALPDKEPHA